MTNNLKIEVLVSNIPEDGSIASQFPSQEYVNQQLAKKANLSPEGRLDPSHAPDYTEIPGLYEHIEDTKDAIETSIADSLQDAKGYTNQQLSTNLQTKADLVNGKIPFDQIPFSADIEDQIQINVENITAVVDQKVAQVVEQVNGVATAANSYTDTKVAETKAYVDTTVGNVIEDVERLGVSKAVTIPTYLTPEAGVAAVTGVAAGAYFNVRSTEDDTALVEYQNIGGVPTPSGKSYPNYAALNNIQHNNLKGRDDAEAHPASAILDKSGKDQQWINNKVAINLNSVAELRAIDLLEDGRLYNVASYRENTGYGGGLFRYDKNSTATDDGGVVIQHNSADGRFIRVNTNFLTVEDFGADPTYTLDSTSAFQNFLNKTGVFTTKDGGKYKVTAALTRTGFFKASGKSEIVFDFSNNTAFTIDADGGEVDIGSLTFNGAADAGRLHRNLVRVNEASGVFGDRHKLINHHYESDTMSLYLWNYGYSCLSNGTYKDITGIVNGIIGDGIGPIRAVYGAGDRDCGALVIKGGVAENINNVDANKNVVWEDADAFVVQLPHKGDLIVRDVVYANIGKRLVKSNANSKSITKVSGCTGSSAWTSTNPTDPTNKGMYSIASAYAGVLQFYDNTHVGGICQHMIETGGAVDVIEYSNIYEPEYSFQTNSQNTRVFRHSATGGSKIIHGLSIVRNVASGGYVEGAASVIELANIQDLAVGGADLYNLNNHIISGNILTGRGTSQSVHRYRGTIGSFSVNGNIYKDWQDCIYLGTDLDAALMIGSVSGNLTKNVSRNLVSEFGTGSTGKIGYAGNYSSNYTSGGKSAVLGQTLLAPTISAGGGTVLPATPLGYLNVSVNGVASFIPYYR